MKKYNADDLKTMLNKIPYDIMIKKQNTEDVVFSNNKFCRIFKCKDEFNVKNASVNFWDKVLKEKKIKLNTAGESVSFEKKIEGCCKDKYIEAYACDFQSGSDNYVGIIGNDITFNKNIDEEVYKSSNLMLSLNALYSISIKNEMQVIIDGIFSEMLCTGIGILFYENDSLVKYAGAGINIKNISELLKYNKNKTILYDEKIIKIIDINYYDDVIGYLYLIYNNSCELEDKEINTARLLGERISVIITNILITNQIKDEYTKRKSTDKELELFLETATDLCIILKNKKDIICVNDRCLKLLGYTKKEFLEHNILDFVHKDDLAEVKKQIEVSKNKKVPNGILCRIVCKDKSEKILDVHWNLIKDKNIIIVTAQDKTDVIKLKAENRQLKDAISLESVKTDFLSNVSHEFKTPLNIILLSTQLMLSKLNNGDYVDVSDFEESIKRIRQNSNKILSLVNNLIDITKIQGGFYKLNMKKYNIVDVIENIVESVADYIQNKNRNIVFDTDEEQIFVLCDPEKIERIMYNLFSNALKYTDDNGTISIKIYYNANKENVIISVKDDGIGIPKEKAKTIFNRFARILSRDCEGSGIGLSLVRSLVELQHGRIWLNEKNKKGAEFLISLPVDKSDMEVNNEKSLIETKSYSVSANMYDI